jgi:alpha-glucosidase
MSTTPWWRRAVTYQVYPRSFADGNGDGTGDIAGIRSRLPYLQALGVDAIWVSPWYVSPLHDGGYDVADYRDIDPRFGTLEEATELFAEAAEHDIRVIVDLVPNHTSSEHPWFREALASPPGSAARGRYHFLPGKGPHGSLPPNNWKSVFGGPAWSRVPDGEWYLHLFDVTQPDLNWTNLEVRQGMADVLRFWLERGAAGFRVDVAHSLTKAPGYPDVRDVARVLEGRSGRVDHPFWDRHDVHEITRLFRSVVDEYEDRMLVAEAWVANWERLQDYLRPDEYHQAFDFEFLESRWDATSMRSAVEESLAGARAVASIPTWVLSNHDVVRVATRYGLPNNLVPKEWLLDGDRSLLDPDLGVRRARAAALLMLALPGSVYLYQGEELGLGEVHDLPVEVLDDPVWLRSAHTQKGRDGCRVPIPWTRAGPSFGFGDDGSWLPQPEGWGERSVEAQEGVTGSTLELYRSALRLRREHLAGDEELEWVDLGPDVVAFRRGSGVVCVVNFGADPVDLPAGDVLLASAPLGVLTLPPDAAAWIETST